MNRRASFLVGALPLLVAVGATPRDAFAQKITFGGGGTAGGGAAGGGAAAPATAPKPASATPAAVPAKTEETIVVPDEWKERDQLLNEASSLAGGAGLLNTQHAQGNAAGQFRLGFMTEFFSSGFLCTSTFPCRNKNGGPAVTNDSLSHIGGTISLGVGITKWLEAYANTGAYANSDDVNKPSLLQVLGDTTFGLKGYGKIANTFHAGGFAELLLINGTGAVGLAGSATSARFGLAATEDLRDLRPSSNIPLRASLNLAYSVDNTGAVVSGTEDLRGGVATGGTAQPVTRIERFGLKVNRVDHFDIHVGAETFFVDDRIRPFVEYSIYIPINRQNYLCKPNNPSSDNCLANDKLAPSKFTVGSRFFPWKGGFNLTAAFTIGVTGTADFIEEMSPVAPWTLFLGAGWNIDTQERPPVEKLVTKEVKIEGKAPVRGHIKGLVHEKDKTEEVKAAIIAWENHPELEALYTGDDGRFVTQELPEGKYAFTVKADGYKDGACETTILKGGADATVDCAVEALPRVGTIVGHVRDAENLAPVANAVIKLTDHESKPLQVTADSNGAYRFEGVAPGAAVLQVDAEDYMTFVDSTDVKVRQEVTADSMIRHRPKQGLVQVGKTEITIKQQIQFAVDQAVILPESTPLLNEIADALIHNPRIKKIEIQGHTDNSGTPEHNQTLSDQRADAVRQWLVGHGVTSDRLISKGYGQSKPLVPNVTPAMKQKNRRVQFIIQDQEAEVPTTGAAGTGSAGTGPKKPPPF